MVTMDISISKVNFTSTMKQNVMAEFPQERIWKDFERMSNDSDMSTCQDINDHLWKISRWRLSHTEHDPSLTSTQTANVEETSHHVSTD